MTNSEIKIFKAKDGKTEIQVKLDKDTVWLNQYQLEDLFQTDRSAHQNQSVLYRPGFAVKPRGKNHCAVRSGPAPAVHSLLVSRFLPTRE
jgi:hypothetical protein